MKYGLTNIIYYKGFCFTKKYSYIRHRLWNLFNCHQAISKQIPAKMLNRLLNAISLIYTELFRILLEVEIPIVNINK